MYDFLDVGFTLDDGYVLALILKTNICTLLVERYDKMVDENLKLGCENV